LQQFVRGQAAVLTAELFFDTSDRGTGLKATAVTTLTEQGLRGLADRPGAACAADRRSFAGARAFPRAMCRHRCSSRRATPFAGVVTGVRQSFTFFSRFGVPLRAKPDLTLREDFPLHDQLRDLRLASPDRTHGHVLRRDETLAQLGGGAISGRPANGGASLKANRIGDPRRLEPGLRLALPPIPASGRAS
jgi:hypothetical protein